MNHMGASDPLHIDFTKYTDLRYNFLFQSHLEQANCVHRSSQGQKCLSKANHVYENMPLKEASFGSQKTQFGATSTTD